jgi:hypothetical protein
MCPGTDCCPDDSAQVVRVRNLIQDHDKWRLSLHFGGFEYFFKRRVLICRSIGNHSLVILGYLVQPPALNELHHHASFLCHAYDLTRGTGKLAPGYHQFLKVTAGFDGFTDGVAPCEEVNTRRDCLQSIGNRVIYWFNPK